MGLMMLTCREASRLQSMALDRRLSLVERTSLRLHTAMCRCCRKVSLQMEFIRLAARGYPGPDDTPR